jgi:hypothetical protein
MLRRAVALAHDAAAWGRHGGNDYPRLHDACEQLRHDLKAWPAEETSQDVEDYLYLDWVDEQVCTVAAIQRGEDPYREDEECCAAGGAMSAMPGEMRAGLPFAAESSQHVVQLVDGEDAEEEEEEDDEEPREDEEERRWEEEQQRRYEVTYEWLHGIASCPDPDYVWQVVEETDWASMDSD